jgi:hypothetical protein
MISRNWGAMFALAIPDIIGNSGFLGESFAEMIAEIRQMQTKHAGGRIDNPLARIGVKTYRNADAFVSHDALLLLW